MAEDKCSFAERYRERDSKELKLLAESGELNEEAQAAIEAELKRRDVRFKKPSPPKVPEDESSYKEPSRPVRSSRPMPLEEEAEGNHFALKLPSAGFGYLLAALIALVGFLEGGFLITPLIVVAAYIHWLYCVGRIHHSVQKWTLEQYAIGPGMAVLLHFIPIINLFWIFFWPGLLGSELRAKGHDPGIGALLGLNTLFGTIFVGLGQGLPGMLAVFFQLDPRSPAYAIGGILAGLGILFQFLTISAVNSDLEKIKIPDTPEGTAFQTLPPPPRKTRCRPHRSPPKPGAPRDTAGPRRSPRKFRIVFLQPDSRFIEKLRRWP